MDLPKPPADQELRNIIDKLAQFVARNGPEFEHMTKNKQRDNPRFAFLFGGEHYAYYQYRVTSEQALHKQRQTQNQAMNPNVPLSYPGTKTQQTGPPQPPGFSPVNPAMMPNQPPPMQKAWSSPTVPNVAPSYQPPRPSLPVPTVDISGLQGTRESIIQQMTQLQEQIHQSEQNLSAQQQVLVSQQQAKAEEAVRRAHEAQVAKDAQELGVNLVELEHLLHPILESCTKDSISQGKAWIFSHANQTLHHPVIAQYLLLKATSPTAPFLHKLHLIYLLNDVLHHCARKQADQLKNQLESVVAPMFCYAASNISEDQKVKLDKLLGIWEGKTSYFNQGTLQSLRRPQQTWNEFEAGLRGKFALAASAAAASVQQTLDQYRSQHQAFVQHASQQLQQLEQQKTVIEKQIQAALASPPPMPRVEPPASNFNSYSPAIIPSAAPPIDISRPPPGFPPPEPSPQGLHAPYDGMEPAVPYYELPAGLMVPLVKLDDSDFKPLKPEDIRLPPPVPPSERLIQAMEMFYGPPSHENPRNTEGWEQLGLYDYYKAKTNAKRQKELDISEGRREKSPSPPRVTVQTGPTQQDSKKGGKSPIRKRYRSMSPEESKAPSPEPERERPRSRSRSRSGSRSTSPYSMPSFLRRSPQRSPTPPSFGMGKLPVQKIDETNKGHQLLKKMGWGGTGLGSQEQGIAEPISGGEVRDRTDMYKGIGVNMNDPFESFRKNRGQAFIHRMKARAEERAALFKED